MKLPIILCLLLVVGVSVYYDTQSVRQELSEKTQQVEHLQREVQQMSAKLKSVRERIATEANSTGANTVQVDRQEENVNQEELEQKLYQARIATLGKFVPLNESQREQLLEKYRLEGEGEEAPSLGSIVGEENVDFYRKQVGKAFERSRMESFEKDTVYLGRLLGLDRETEDAVHERFLIVDAQIRVWQAEERKAGRKLESPLERMVFQLDETKLRRSLLKQELNKLLTQTQYKAYVTYEAQSSAADYEIWHSPPE